MFFSGFDPGLVEGVDLHMLTELRDHHLPEHEQGTDGFFVECFNQVQELTVRQKSKDIAI